MFSPVWSPHTAAVGHTRALAKQGQQTVRIETITRQLGMKSCAVHSPDRRQGMTTARTEAVLSPASQVAGNHFPDRRLPCCGSALSFRHYHGT
jgi:hypothetical protein